MDINWADVGRVIGTLAPAAVALLGAFRGPGALRSRLRHDADLLEKLPEGSAAHGTLLAHLNDQLERIAKTESEGKRDTSGAAVGGFVAVLFAWLTVFLYTQDDWWWRALSAIAAFLAVFGLAYLFERIQKVPRDEKDNPI